MLAVFCLRLAFGLLASLLLLLAFSINQKFYRVHFLTALALLAGAAVLLHGEADPLLWWLLLPSLLLCVAGSISWHLDNAPFGKLWIILAALSSGVNLLLLSGLHSSPLILADDFTSAAVLGTATTSMLLGHSYLIAPTMSIQPLLRLVLALGGALVCRLLLALVGLWLWTGQHSRDTLETETMLWLAVRWGIGFLAPAILAWMAWETAKIRSPQSATGILYVVVIVCFLGELTSQLLLSKTGFVL
jgi:hypothetical protein